MSARVAQLLCRSFATCISALADIGYYSFIDNRRQFTMPASSTTTLLSPSELAYLHSSLSSHPPIRPDSRLATDFRPFSAEINVLPNTMGSAHVGFADGREAVVGIRAEVERTLSTQHQDVNVDVHMGGVDDEKKQHTSGNTSWISLSLTLPGLRDDDQGLVFLEEMLREVLIAPRNGTSDQATNGKAGSLQDALIINSRWHWRLHIDVVLISPPEGSAAGSYPLPLLSMAIHMALRDTRIPRLKSEGEEDPLADDDWDASVYLYPRGRPGRDRSLAEGVPPVTLLVIIVGENIIFDPNGTELAVADGVLAMSIAKKTSRDTNEVRIVAVRMLQTSARNTFKGVPRAEGGNEWDDVPGVWKSKIGGIKRSVLSKATRLILTNVGKEVIGSLEAFMIQAG